MNDETQIAAMRAALAQWQSFDNWWQQVASGAEQVSGSMLNSKHNSTTGTFFHTDLVQAGPVDRPHGGFFAPITSDNRNEMIAALFDGKGQWVNDFLTPTVLSNPFAAEPAYSEAQRAAFEGAYDRLMVGFLDSTYDATENLDLYSFSDGMTRDQTVTDHELWALLDRHGFKADLDAMGDDLAKRFVMLSGGVIQGIIDYESRNNDGLTYNIYEPSEFDGLWSPEAINAVVELHKQNTGRTGSEEALFNDAVDTMEDLCTNSVNHTFRIPTSRDDSVRCFNGQCR